MLGQVQDSWALVDSQSPRVGLSQVHADESGDKVAEKRLIPDGCGVKYSLHLRPLDKWGALHS